MSGKILKNEKLGGGEMKGEFIEVNGVELFYRQKGQGPPIIMLHGNGENHRIFRQLRNKLSEKRTAYTLDSRDHGRSTQVKVLNYIDMMDDVACFIRKLELHKPALFGFSDGGIVALLLAINHPDMLSGLIVSGANTRPDGVKMIAVVLTKIAYFFTRNQKYKLMLTQPDIKDTELASIVTPTLVLAGRNDLIKEEHTRNIAAHIKDSTLIILEGENHTSYVVRSEKLEGIIEPFLDGLGII